MAIKISLQNEVGELDCRVVETEEETNAAAIEMISGMTLLQSGDRIVVTEID